jgi:hypothetical protein
MLDRTRDRFRNLHILSARGDTSGLAKYEKPILVVWCREFSPIKLVQPGKHALEKVFDIRISWAHVFNRLRNVSAFSHITCPLSIVASGPAVLAGQLAQLRSKEFYLAR